MSAKGKGPQPPADAQWHIQKGHGLLGERIVIVCRRFNGPWVCSNSGTHKGQAGTASQNARAWLEVPARHVAEAAKKK